MYYLPMYIDPYTRISILIRVYPSVYAYIHPYTRISSPYTRISILIRVYPSLYAYIHPYTRISTLIRVYPYLYASVPLHPSIYMHKGLQKNPGQETIEKDLNPKP
jgi:hypothetical protein